jgi:DNA-binding MarR family transcriptional regulator
VIPSGTRSSGRERLTDQELAAWRGMLQVSFRLRREMGEALARHGLAMPDYDVLVTLAAQPRGRMRMNELADAVLQPRSSLTRITDGLERRGLIHREPCEVDARGTWAVLTREGRAAFRDAHRTHIANVRRLFLDRLADEQLEQLAAAWEAVGS